MTHAIYNTATHRVVPIEPTLAMTLAADVELDALSDWSTIYEALLNNAPDASRPLPTRESIIAVLENTLHDYCDECTGAAADAVLALLKGETP